MPVLVAVGSKDAIAGDAAALAALLPHGRALDIPGRDHMLAVGDKVFKAGVLAFLAERTDRPAGASIRGRSRLIRPLIDPWERPAAWHICPGVHVLASSTLW